MLLSPLRWILATGLLIAIPAGLAQTSAGTVAPSTALQYHSVFARYRAFNDQPIASWPEVNDTVGKIGGWRVYAREAKRPAPADGNSEPAASGQGAGGDASKSMGETHTGRGGKP